MKERFPEGLSFRVSAAIWSPRITDFIGNRQGMLMVNERTKLLIEAHAVADVEYLRFALVNHKGRVAGDRFHIVNVLGAVDCADRAGTRAIAHPAFRGEAQLLRRLVLDPDRIPPHRNLLRPSILPRAVLVRDDLRRLLESSGVTGASYVELGDIVP